MDRLYDIIILAQAGAGAQPAGPAGGGAAAPGGGAPMGQPACGGGEQLLFMLGMLVLFYFLLIRPQQKRSKQHRELIGALKRGDNVITSSGILGRIVDIDGNRMTLEIAKNTQIQILKSYVAGIANADTETSLAQNPQAGS